MPPAPQSAAPLPAVRAPQVSALPPGFVRSSRTLQLILAPAGQTQSIQRVPQAGIRFYIVESDNDAALKIKTDTGVEEFFTVGTGKEFTEDQPFTALQIENTSSDIITISLFAGFGDYIDKRTTIVGNRLTSILPTIEPKTKLVTVAALGGGFNSIAASTTVALTGVPATGQLRRKAIYVSNEDPASILEILDAAGNLCMKVFPETSIVITTSEAVSLKNPTALAVPCTFAELWWMKP